MHFLPGFIDAQTNRLQHVFRDLEAYGIPEMLGEQWAPYKSYTMCKYYGMWLRFFQRQPGKELACVGDVHGTPCPHTVRVDMEGEATSIRRKLEVLQMDHSMPKHAICTQWKKSVAGWWREHGHEAGRDFTFHSAVNIDYVNHLLFSVEHDSIWGAPMVRPRCYISSSHCNCHKSELEHCRMIGIMGLNQLDLNPTSTHQHSEGGFMQEAVHVLQVGDDGDAGGDGDGGGDSDEDGGTGEELQQQQGQREEQEPMQEDQAQEHMQEEHKQEPQEQAQEAAAAGWDGHEEEEGKVEEEEQGREWQRWQQWEQWKHW